MITRPLLRSLRNDLPMPFTFQQLGTKHPTPRPSKADSASSAHTAAISRRSLIHAITWPTASPAAPTSTTSIC